jgi:hypothetical protein
LQRRADAPRANTGRRPSPRPTCCSGAG